MAAFSFDIDVPVRSEWSNVDLLITSVENCFTAMFADVEGCHALAVVTGELLENAIKYGDWSGGHAVFRLHVSGLDKNASITVENPVSEDSSQVERLFAALKWLEGFSSADEAYRARLLEIANTPPGEGMSGLGLARIAYEANCKLHAERDRGRVRVTARLAL
jgi:hypothetical protein